MPSWQLPYKGEFVDRKLDFDFVEEFESSTQGEDDSINIPLVYEGDACVFRITWGMSSVTYEVYNIVY